MNETCIQVDDVSVRYGDRQVLSGIGMRIPQRRVTAFIGPSGCGKSTLLRCFNRMTDLIENARVTGRILLNGKNIHAPGVDVAGLRRQVGMVFQKPNPFPKSVYENVAFGLRLKGGLSKAELDDRVEWALKSAGLWNEVLDRLRTPALELSGGQQQRLVIARALAVKPDVLLLDEPASALDPISTARIEELIDSLKSDYTIVIVTPNLQQAARVSDCTAFLNSGKLVEFDTTQTVFTNPADRQTEDYITGRYG